MKKALIVSLIPVFIFLIPFALIGGSLFLTGCTEDVPERYESMPQAAHFPDGIFSKSRFPYINQVFGYPHGADWIRLWDSLSAYGEAAYIAGEWTEPNGKEGFVRMAERAGQQQVVLLEEYEAALANNTVTNLVRSENDYIEILEIASYTGIGDVLNELFTQLGRDALPHHIYPLLQHYFTMPTDLYHDFVNAVEEGGGFTPLSEEDFGTLMEVLKRMLDDKDETYGPIWDTIPSAWSMIDRVRDYGDTADVEDGKDLLDSLLDIIQDPPVDITGIEVDGDENLAEALADAMDKVRDEGEIVLTQEIVNGNLVDLAEPEILTFQGELQKLLNSVGMLMNNQRPYDSHDADNEWDDNGSMTDLARVLLSLQKLMDADTLPRDKFMAFLDAFITASAAMDGADSFNGALGTYYNPVYFAGMDDALIQLFTKTGCDEPITPGVDVSAVRLLLYAIQAGNMDGMGSLIDFGLSALTEDEGMVHRSNVLDWAMGEATTASMKFPGAPFDGLDYLLYEKNYEILGVMFCWPWPINLITDPDCFPIAIGNFEGLFTMLEMQMITFFIDLINFDEFLSAVYLAFGIERSGGACNYSNVVGVTNQLLFIMPGIEHFYTHPHDNHDGNGWEGNQYGWEHPLMSLGQSLNEINALATHDEATATGVMKTLEGPGGYGLATYALRDHSSDSSDEGLLDPVFTMLSMIVNQLIDTAYNDPNYTYYDGTKYEGTLWAALMDYIKENKLFGLDMDALDDMDVENGRYQLISDLFYPTDDCVLDDTHKALADLHDIIAIFAEDIGKVILAVTEDDTRYNRIMDDIDIISDLVDKMAIDTDTGAMGAFGDLGTYFVEENEDGSDNQFMANMKALLFKIFDVKPYTYTIEDSIMYTELEDRERDILARHGIPPRTSGETDDDFNSRTNYQYYLDLYKNIDEGVAWWFKEGNRNRALLSYEQWEDLAGNKPGDDTFGIPRDFTGTHPDGTPLSELFANLYGADDDLEGGVYSLNRVRDFVDELLDSNVDFMGALEDNLREILVERDYDAEQETFACSFAIMKDLQWDYWIDKRAMQYWMNTSHDFDMDGEIDLPMFQNAFRMFNLAVDMNGVLEDNILFWGGPDMLPDGYTWLLWKDIIEFQVFGLDIWKDH